MTHNADRRRGSPTQQGNHREGATKFRMFPCITAATLLFTAMAMSNGVQAQGNLSQNKRPKHQKYKLVDLGTFGGPQSFYFSSPVVKSVSNFGTAVGAADTPIQDPFYPNCDTPDCLLLRGF